MHAPRRRRWAGGAWCNFSTRVTAAIGAFRASRRAAWEARRGCWARLACPGSLNFGLGEVWSCFGVCSSSFGWEAGTFPRLDAPAEFWRGGSMQLCIIRPRLYNAQLSHVSMPHKVSNTTSFPPPRVELLNLSVASFCECKRGAFLVRLPLWLLSPPGP